MIKTDQPAILTSLQSLRTQIEGRLSGESRYRALRAIEDTIADLSEFEDLSQPLCDIRERIQGQLGDSRDYRALCAVDSMLPQLAEVLAVAGSAHDVETSTANADEPASVNAGARLVDTFSASDDSVAASGPAIATSDEAIPSRDSEPAPVATLAYDLASMLVQSLPPGEQRPKPAHAIESDGEPPPDEADPRREGRAA